MIGRLYKLLHLEFRSVRFCKEKLKFEFTINASEENTLERLYEITSGDMATVVIDATGSRKAINNGLQYVAHGGKYILIGLQKEEICFSHPEFHKRETTLMSSRNATKQDFDQVIESIKNGLIDPANYITHRLKFDQLKDSFPGLLVPESNVIKAMVEMD